MNLDWHHNSKLVTELPPNCHGFVYKLHLANSLFYIGKVNAKKKITLPALKSGEIRPGAERIGKNKNGKRVYFDIIYKESDWKNYTSSSEEVKDHTIIHKEILEYAPTKRSLTYLEEKHQFLNNVLEDETYINQNIGGRYFRSKLL